MAFLYYSSRFRTSTYIHPIDGITFEPVKFLLGDYTEDERSPRMVPGARLVRTMVQKKEGDEKDATPVSTANRLKKPYGN